MILGKKTFFYFLVFVQNDLEIVFGDLFHRKESFLTYKNMCFR